VPIGVSLFLSPHAQTDPGAREAVGRWMNATSRANLAAELRAMIACEDLRARLGELACPVVSRWGALDAAVPRARAEEIAAGARRGRLEIVEGVGHALTIEDREATIGSLARALRDA
jgi:pimeloyl-ACP methyl ester carboxylesterase